MKARIGIPRSLFYYYYKDIWLNFFNELDIDIIVSPKTNKEIIEYGMRFSTDEMCLSMKNYIGHVAYLIDKCDYILIPRIDNYGSYNQNCTNFLAVYDYICNTFDKKILNYNIDLCHNENEKNGLIKIALELGVSKRRAFLAYDIALLKVKKIFDDRVLLNKKKLNSLNIKILFVSHSYNTFDEFIGMPIIRLFEKMNVDIIYSDKFDIDVNQLSNPLAPNLYWKYSKDMIQAINKMKRKVDGIVFLSTFPCGIDSLVNELVMRNIDMPFLNIIVDDLDSLSGVETRIESFVDILKQKLQIS